jgi:DNA-binding transcriptional MocR family regulator
MKTLSKCLTPGLRVAFVLIRDPHERARFLVASKSFALMVAPLTRQYPPRTCHSRNFSAYGKV